MKGPTRLCDQGELPSTLASALGAAPGDPSAAELAALSTQVGGALGLTLAPPTAVIAASSIAASSKAAVGAAASMTSKPALPWLAWVLTGVAAGVGMSAAVTWSSTALLDAPRAAAPAKAPAAPSPPPFAPATSKVAEAEPPAPPGVSPAATAPAARAPGARPSSSALIVEATKSTELTLLREATRYLERDPSRTLALCAEHARSHAGGALGQERDVLRIDALVRLGRATDARAHFAAFTRQYPDSAHTPRLRARLEKIAMPTGEP